MKKYYVSFPDQSWHSDGYLTAGRRYIFEPDGDGGGDSINDDGDEMYLSLAGSAHLNGHSWTLHEEEE